MICNNINKCSAPICPSDQQSFGTAIWFPDEEICNQVNDTWIKAQKKIKDKAKDSTTCYTHKMLSRNCKIGKAIKGIDPDKDIEAEEVKWISRHPVKKDITKAQREILRERALKMRARLSA